MSADIFFVVPIRHPNTVRDRDAQARGLRSLFRSLDALVDDGCEIRIACDVSQELPRLPKRAVRVDLTVHPQAIVPREISNKDLTPWVLDKGARIEAALEGVPLDAMFMSVDDDDLLHKDILKTVRAGPDGAAGWFAREGYLWEDGAQWLYPCEGYQRICGSSIMIRLDALRHYRGADAVKRRLEIAEHRALYTALCAARETSHVRGFPFPAGVYRRGHDNSMQTAASRHKRASARKSVEGVIVDLLPRGLRPTYHRMKRAALRKTDADADNSYILVKWDRAVPWSPALRTNMLGGADIDFAMI